MRPTGEKFKIATIVLASAAMAAIILTIAMASAVPRSSAANAGRARTASAINHARADRFPGDLPLTFEANRGQTDWRVKFLARGDGYTLFLTHTGATLALRSSAPAKRGGRGKIQGAGERLCWKSRGAHRPRDPLKAFE
ncbi:MAG: hypothetical protein ACREQI_15495, partial [Candidatus Binataceae bacterium]